MANKNFNKTNASSGIPQSNDIRTQQASVINENAQKSEYSQRFANASNKQNRPNQLNERNLTITRLRYPEDLGIYYMGFEFQEYTKSDLKQSPKTSIRADVALPPPPQLVDALHQRYEELQQGLIGGFFDTSVDKSKLALAGTAAVAAATAASLVDNRYGVNSQNAGRQLVNIATRSSGLAFNPFLAVFYVSPSFKQHEFIWRFSPKTASESNTIRDIIKLFHQRMSPTIEVGGVFFGYPDVVIPKLYCGDAEQQYLYDFKPCVVENCIVNYAPTGVPSFFAGTRAPTEIEFRLSLKEMDLWLRSDYDGERTTGSGVNDAIERIESIPGRVLGINNGQ
jgi:hypothetical protein